MRTKTFAAVKNRAEQIVAELKAAQEAKQRYDEAIDEALANAGRARVEFVEMLYEFFGIEEESTERTDGSGAVKRTQSGKVIRVKTDKDESKRIARLTEAFEQLVQQSEAVEQQSSHQSF